MYREGTVVEVDAERCKARVQFEDSTSGWLSVLQRNTKANKDQGLPDVDEFVACMLDTGGESGCILGAVYTRDNTPPDPSPDVRRVTFSDGTVIEYDRDASVLKVAAVGDVYIDGSNVEITGSTVLVEADCTVSESLTVGNGAAAVTRDDKLQQALNTLKSAISSAMPGSMDGGAALKSAIVGALSTWPPDTAATKLTTD
jgi:phage baseplate assembly protein V